MLVAEERGVLVWSKAAQHFLLDDPQVSHKKYFINKKLHQFIKNWTFFIDQGLVPTIYKVKKNNSISIFNELCGLGLDSKNMDPYLKNFQIFLAKWILQPSNRLNNHTLYLSLCSRKLLHCQFKAHINQMVNCFQIRWVKIFQVNLKWCLFYWNFCFWLFSCIVMKEAATPQTNAISWRAIDHKLTPTIFWICGLNTDGLHSSIHFKCQEPISLHNWVML